jgi:hypothetical protein
MGTEPRGDLTAILGGLSVPEVATALAVSDTTVEGDWRYARAWLHDQLGGATP